jgi:CelD/BcsL family acetyltransferase involved in cellulose biosynthesis
MTLEVSLESTERLFELPGWRELVARDPNKHIFATPEWNKLWWDEFGNSGPRKELLPLTLRRGDDLIGMVPLYRKEEGDRKILRFIGGIDLTDYLGPLCGVEDRREVADTLVDWLTASSVEWDEFDAHNMPVPFEFAELLVESADRHNMDFKLEQEETSAVLPLPSSWDEYETALKSKERHELRRKRRRLEREHPDATVRTATPDTLEADMKTFIEMHRGAEGHKGHFMRPEIATFFERIAADFSERGWLRLDLLEIGNSAVAGTFSFVLDDRFYLYNSAYELDAARLSPGLVLVSELVKRSIDEGLRFFDFLRGPERYKYQLGGQAVPLNNVRLVKER